ncbi:MAG: nicotinamide mononucleotide transporter [Acidobacteria bacterium]|nr:nicotinamide mononucleotide transporter [Acidobacteriota bacterium]
MNLLQFYGIDWFATACGLAAVFLLGNKNKFGFLVFMMASLSWIAFGIYIGSYAVITGSSIFFIMHLRGFLKWRKDELDRKFVEVQELNSAK